MYKIKTYLHLLLTFNPRHLRRLRFLAFCLSGFLALWLSGCSVVTNNQQPTISEQQFASNPVLLSNRINCISASAEDVWIATNQGVNRYTDDKWFKYTIDDGLADNDVQAVAVDGDFIWFGTNSGLSRYNRTSQKWKTFTRDHGIASNMITSLAVDGNYLWVGTPRGLSRYNKSLDVWALHTKEDGGLNSDRINTVTVEDDYVWIATDEGVSRYDKNKDSWNKYTEEDGLAENDTRCIAIAKDSVWFGTYNSGVSEFSKIDQTFVRTYTRSGLLVSNKIKSIYVDSLYLWIGTANTGIQRYITTVDTWMQYTTADGLASNHITSIDSQKRYVWFGTSEHGVSRFDKISGSFTNFSKAERLVSNNVKEVVSDGESLWIATQMGLAKFSPNSGAWERFTKADGLVTDYITCIALDKKDVWIGSSKGVGYYDDNIKRWKFWTERDGLPDNFVLSIYAPRNMQHDDSNTRNVWIGTKKGLVIYDQEEERWSKLEAFAEKVITEIAFNKYNVWIGTDSGLFCIDKTDIPTALDSPVIDGYINKVVFSDDEIYVCTQKGLAIIDGGNLRYAREVRSGSFYLASVAKRTTFHLAKRMTREINKWYTSDDGLPSDNVRDVLKINGELWIATPKGLCSLNQSGNLTVYNLENTGSKMGHENVRSICVCYGQSKDNIWLATEGGLSKISVDKDEWKVFKAQEREDLLRHSYIPHILLDEEQIWSYSWYGTSNGEIIKYDRRTNTWTLYTKEDILNYESKHETRNTYNASRVMFVRWADADEDSVWFATDAGILRYKKDSDTWRRYTVSDGLASNRTTWVKTDGDYIWVRLSEPRICWYNKKTGNWYTKKIASKEGWRSPRKIAVDEQYVWIPNGWDGIFRYDKKNKNWKKYTKRDGLSESTVENVVASGNYVWVEGEGVDRYNYYNDTWINIDDTTGLARVGGIRDVFDGRDYLWILYYSWRGDRDRAAVAASGYHKENGKWQTFRGNPETVGNDFVSVRETDDAVWFASDEHGLSRYDKASGSWTVYTKDDGLLSDETNEDTLQVDERYVWIGTREGISRYDTLADSWTSYTGRKTLTNNRIRALAVDGRYIWCGTEDGLSRYDKRYNEWTNFHARRWDWWRYEGFMEFEELEGLSDNNITSIAVDPKFVWVGTQDGMNRYDKLANRWDTYDRRNGLPNSEIRAASVGESDVWIGTPEGVAKYARLSDDPNAWEPFNKTIEVEAGLVTEKFAKSLASNDIRCLYLDERYLWVGTKKGVSRYDTSREVWEDIVRVKSERVKSEKTLVNHQSLNNTSAIAIDGDSVWFGSDKGAIYWNQETDTWKHYTESDGLASKNVTDIAVTEDSVWFATFDNGVSRYVKESGKWMTFTKKDGLSHNSVSSVAVDGKFMWLGTDMGLSRYDTVTDTWTVFTANFEEENY